MKPLRPVLLAVLALAGAACASKSSLPPVDPPTPLAAFKPALTLTQRWSVQMDEGTGGQFLKLVPLVSDGRVFVASRKGVVEAHDAQTGARVWRAELGTDVLGGIGDGGDLILLGGDAEVVALDKKDGSVRWRGPVSSEVLARPIRAGHVVVAHAVDGYVNALDAGDGHKLWRFRQEVPLLSLRARSAPVAVGSNGVVVGFANAQVAALGLEDGRLFWQGAAAVPRGRSELERMVDVDADPQVADGAVYSVSYQGRLTALALDSGRLLWSRELSSYSGMALAGRDLYATDSHGDLWAFARAGGGTLWKQTALHGRRLTSPAVEGDALVVADYEGYLHWLARDDGRLLARAQIGSGDASGKAEESAGKYKEEQASIAPPVVAGDWVYAVNARGMLSAFQVGKP